MAMNLRNHGVAIVRLTRDVQVFPNKDGSRKILFTGAATDNFKNREGKRGAQYLPFEAFVAAKNKTNGVYDLIHKGDLIAVQYTVKTPTYTDEKTGETIYKVALVPENIDMLESKSVTTARQNKNGEAPAAQAPVQKDDAPATPVEDEELPFGNGTGVEQ